MSFEDGSEPMQDPFSEEDDDEVAESSEEIDQAEDTAEEQEPETKQEPETQPTRTERETQDRHGATQQETPEVPDLSDVDVRRHHSPEEIARLLMDREYHEEDPQVPYAMWRNGTSTGRDRTTIELNPNVDELVKTVMREFESRYDAEINKADLREFAMIYGLMNADDLFEMAEEWGLQFNS